MPSSEKTPSLFAYTENALGSGAQPLTNDDGSVILSVNGEIYNYVSLQKSLKGKYDFKTQSDCEVLLYLVWFFCSERDIKSCIDQLILRGCVLCVVGGDGNRHGQSS